MSLLEQIEAFKVEFTKNVPAESRQKMQEATEALIATGIEQQVLKQGQEFPSFELPNATGQTIRLDDQLKNGPVVITFYRGGWCPYCNLELKELQNHLDEIKAQGAQLIAISPQTPDASLDTQEKNNLQFEVLSDAKNQVARQIGLVFQLPDEIVSIYKGLGIDVEQSNGETSHELPLPATFIVDRQGVIQFVEAEGDYSKRTEPAAIVEELKKLSAAV